MLSRFSIVNLIRRFAGILLLILSNHVVLKLFLIPVDCCYSRL